MHLRRPQWPPASNTNFSFAGSPTIAAKHDSRQFIEFSD